MGKIVQYKCIECGYTADVYEGRGFMGQHIVMVSCPDCHTIQPLVTGGVIGDSAPSFNSIVGRLCLQCGSSRITEWDKRSCPKCNSPMKPTGESEFWM
jgi:Zn finger protein HypA/HybF involved in hydrogenase expression